MTTKTFECASCSVEAAIDYDYDSTGMEPQFCPFCGSSYIQEELEDFDLLKDGGFDDDMDIQW